MHFKCGGGIAVSVTRGRLAALFRGMASAQMCLMMCWPASRSSVLVMAFREMKYEQAVHLSPKLIATCRYAALVPLPGPRNGGITIIICSNGVPSYVNGSLGNEIGNAANAHIYRPWPAALQQ